jgi:hypothetical protein
MKPKKVNPTVTSKAKAAESKSVEFALEKQNYLIVIIGLALIFIGFLLMIGGGSKDPNIFNEKIFSPRRLTLAPILILLGYMIDLYAIMKKPRD